MRGVEQEGEVPDERTVLKTTLNIAWPSILESFLISLVGMVDTVMVSSLGSYAIAAVGLTTQPKFIALAVFMSLNVAISAIVARRRGEGDRDSANRVLVQALIISVALTVVISVVTVIWADPIIRLCGSAPDPHDAAVGYLEQAGVSEPEEGTPRRAQYDLCVNFMVLRDFDLREATITGTIVNDNPAFRRLLTQLKLTEPDVSKLDTSGGGEV